MLQDADLERAFADENPTSAAAPEFLVSLAVLAFAARAERPGAALGGFLGLHTIGQSGYLGDSVGRSS